MNRLALALLALTFATAYAEGPVAQSPDVWIGARPSVEISVRPSSTAGTFMIAAVVKDLRNGEVLSKPMMLVKAGAPAKLEVGAQGVPDASALSVAVTVAGDGKTAAYSSEVRSNGEVVSSQQATLAVER
jgi:hypothetical protein